jgi:mannose-6-phosphate isomerase-like protein (cupin superfamily)
LTFSPIYRKLTFVNPSPKSKLNTPDPILTPHGEIIYELIGRPDDHGGVLGHSVAQVVLPAGKASRPHHHQVSEETYYILSGQARMHLDERQFELLPGQAVLILPKQVHQIFNIGESNLEFLAICSPAWFQEDTFFSGSQP